MTRYGKHSNKGGPHVPVFVLTGRAHCWNTEQNQSVDILDWKKCSRLFRNAFKWLLRYIYPLYDTRYWILVSSIWSWSALYSHREHHIDSPSVDISDFKKRCKNAFKCCFCIIRYQILTICVFYLVMFWPNIISVLAYGVAINNTDIAPQNHHLWTYLTERKAVKRSKTLYKYIYVSVIPVHPFLPPTGVLFWPNTVLLVILWQPLV